MKLAALGLLLCFSISGCAALKRDYQTYDRSHQRRVDLSYDTDSQTVVLGYTITPIGPVRGYAK